jgi:hypothetical protein
MTQDGFNLGGALPWYCPARETGVEQLHDSCPPLRRLRQLAQLPFPFVPRWLVRVHL